MRRLLVLRPEPGAAATVARATSLGLEAVAAPLFTVRPLAWVVPDPAAHDAIMLTSANALRHGGADLARYRRLPLFAVGGATAAAARELGFADITSGGGDAGALMALMVAHGVRRPLHLCGREYRPVAERGMRVTRVAVYAADAVEHLPAHAAAALGDGAVALLHSPRAARLFSDLIARTSIDRSAVPLATISPAAAQAAGPGWAGVAIAASPDDPALLAAARALCE